MFGVGKSVLFGVISVLELSTGGRGAGKSRMTAKSTSEKKGWVRMWGGERRVWDQVKSLL